MKACIFTVIKDEQEYLEQFIQYTLSLGINHIFLAEDIDSVSHKEITDKYPKVTLIGVLQLFNDEEKKQILHLKECGFCLQGRYFRQGLKYIQDNYNYDWCFIIDIDEYITIDEDLPVGEILKDYTDYDAVLLQLDNYGANGIIEKPDYTKNRIVDIYTKPCCCQYSDKNQWYQQIKTVYNLNRFTDNLYLSDHLPNLKSNWCKTNYTQDIDIPVYNRIYIRHYITKSWEDYIYKIGVRGMFYKTHRNYDSFFEMNPDMLEKKEELMKTVNAVIESYCKK